MIITLFLSFFCNTFEYTYVRSCFHEQLFKNVTLTDRFASSEHRFNLLQTGTLLYAQSLDEKLKDNKQKYKDWYYDLNLKENIIGTLWKLHTENHVGPVRKKLKVDKIFIDCEKEEYFSESSNSIQYINWVTIEDSNELQRNKFANNLFPHYKEKYFQFLLWAVLRQYGKNCREKMIFEYKIDNILKEMPIELYALPSIINYCKYGDLGTMNDDENDSYYFDTPETDYRS